MISRTDNFWPWRRLVGIGVAATLVAGGLHFYEQRHLRGTSSLLDDLSTVRSAVYRAVAVAETSSGNLSVPMEAVVDLRRVGPQIERLRAAPLPEADRLALADFLDSVALLERKLVDGGLTDAEVQAALRRPDAISSRIDATLRDMLTSRRNDLDATYAFALVVAVALFQLAVVSSRRAERRREAADRRLAVREEQYRLMVESLQEGVLIFGADAKVEAGNAAAERVLGAKVAELRQLEIAQWHSVDEAGDRVSPENQPVCRALASGQPVRDVTLCVYRPQQEPIWLVVNAIPLTPELGGRERGAVVTFSDVTAARATRLALQESESTSESLMNALQDGVFVAQDGAFVLANTSLARMLGYDRQEFEGLTFDAVIDPPQLERWHRLMQSQTADTKGARTHEVRFARKDSGAAIEFEMVCSFETFRGRHAVLGLVRDISDRSVARAELKLYRSHLEEIVRARTSELETALMRRTEADTFTRLIADNIPGQLAYWDKDLHCRFVNRGYAESLGLGVDAFVGREVEEILGAEAAPHVTPRMRAALEGQAQRFELDEPLGTDRSRRTLYQYVPDSRDHGVEGFFVLALDVTESRDSGIALQRLNDELVIERDRSAAASTAKSAFLANMSHEIRTPMNAIIGLTHLMRRENPGGALGERLARVAVAAQHLLGLLDDILDLSKIDAGKLLLDDTEFTLDSLLAGACEMVTDAAREKGVDLLVGPSQVPQRLRGDPMRLSQALVNLLGNAVKFIEEGSITLAARVLERHDDVVRIRFEVRDTGPGVAPDMLTTLFEAFEQADSSTTRRFGGTGLGLAITRQLAQLMRGRAGAESKLGAGSTFWIEVELRSPDPQDAAIEAIGDRAAASVDVHRFSSRTPPALDLSAETSLRRLHSGARVLLAEDNRINQEVAVTLLQQAGLQVDVAHDGRQAVKMAAASVYALILMDMQMPLLDGPAATELIRALPGASSVPIVAMTASAYVEDRDRCMAAGMNDFIAKPVDPSRLYATIERWLGELPPAKPNADGTQSNDAGDFTGIQGLDAMRGRAFFGGDGAIYRRALKQFSEMYAQGIAFDGAAKPADEATPLIRLQRDLHSFSGASSAIGAAHLGHEAALLEKKLRDRSAPMMLESLADLNSRLRQFVDALRPHL